MPGPGKALGRGDLGTNSGDLLFRRKQRDFTRRRETGQDRQSRHKSPIMLA